MPGTFKRTCASMQRILNIHANGNHDVSLSNLDVIPDLCGTQIMLAFVYPHIVAVMSTQ